MKSEAKHTEASHTPPQGYKLCGARDGVIQSGDLLWCPESGDWEAAETCEIECPVTVFKAVARPSTKDKHP